MLEHNILLFFWYVAGLWSKFHIGWDVSFHLRVFLSFSLWIIILFLSRRKKNTITCYFSDFFFVNSCPSSQRSFCQCRAFQWKHSCQKPINIGIKWLLLVKCNINISFSFFVVFFWTNFFALFARLTDIKIINLCQTYVADWLFWLFFLV